MNDQPHNNNQVGNQEQVGYQSGSNQDQDNIPLSYLQQQVSNHHPVYQEKDKRYQNSSKQQNEIQQDSKVSNVSPEFSAEDPLNPSSQYKFVKKRRYNDVWAAVLFIFGLAGFFVCTVFGIHAFKLHQSQNENNGGPLSLFNPSDYVVLFGGSIILGFVISAVYFAAMKRYAGKLIQISFILQIALLVAFTILFFFLGLIIIGIVFLFITLMTITFYIVSRSKFAFAKVMLGTVNDIISKYPATLIVGFIGLIVQMAFTSLWIVALLGVTLNMLPNTQPNTPQNACYYTLLGFLFFTYYWTTQVIKNVVHVTVSGLFATYYFYGVSDMNGTVSVSVVNPTKASAKRAMTYSFGSICFGSLIIAIIQIIKFAFRLGQDQYGNKFVKFLFCCFICCLGCFADIADYFNLYAYTQVAIYGKDFCDAAKSTWKLVKSKGVDALINNSLIGHVLGLGSFCVGIIGAAFGATVVAASSTIPKDFGTYIIVCLISFAVCVSEFSILAEVIHSGVATTFVCMAEDPSALQRTKPQLYQSIKSTYPAIAI